MDKNIILQSFIKDKSREISADTPKTTEKPLLKSFVYYYHHGD